MKTLLLPAFLLLVGIAPAIAATSAEDQAVYDWYDTLGHPKLSDLPWATVRLQFQFENQQPDKQEYPAFIGKGGKDSIELIAPDLRLFVLDPANPDYHISPGTFHWEARDLAADMRSMLAGPLPEPLDKRQPFFTGWLPQRAQLLIYARTLHTLGEEELASALLAAARKLSSPHDTPKQSAAFHDALENDFAGTEMRRLLQVHGGINFTLGSNHTPAPRTEVLQKADRIARLFPKTPKAAKARHMAETLRRMSTDAALHPSISDAELDKLPVQDRVAELIYRLRDLNVQSWSNGRANLLPEHAAHKDNTARRLADLGHVAVPQLIEALNDTRLSRSIDMEPEGPTVFTPHCALTIGDCAERILERIANRRFFQPSKEQPTMSDSGKVEETKQAALAWREEAQKKAQARQ